MSKMMRHCCSPKRRSEVCKTRAPRSKAAPRSTGPNGFTILPPGGDGGAPPAALPPPPPPPPALLPSPSVGGDHGAFFQPLSLERKLSEQPVFLMSVQDLPFESRCPQIGVAPSPPASTAPRKPPLEFPRRDSLKQTEAFEVLREPRGLQKMGTSLRLPPRLPRALLSPPGSIGTPLCRASLQSVPLRFQTGTVFLFCTRISLPYWHI